MPPHAHKHTRAHHSTIHRHLHQQKLYTENDRYVFKESINGHISRTAYSKVPPQINTVITRMLSCSTCSSMSARRRSVNLYAPCVLSIGQAFRYSPEKAFYIFNPQIYFIIWHLLDRALFIFHYIFWDLLNNLNLFLYRMSCISKSFFFGS